jgi:hypothetical protein
MQLSTSVTLRLNSAEINRLTRQPAGMVGQSVARAAQKTAQKARSLAPVKTGAYRASIRATEVKQGPNGPTASVVAGVPYAAVIEFKQRDVLRQAARSLKPADFT